MAKSFLNYLGGLWKVQYAPRERLIKNSLNKTALAKWNKLRTTQKIVIIDKLQSKGVFDRR
jgi:hypothetical protein